ncbi:hypothetical protein DL768_009058 [Monosporascus sp. mg162]|nr:hypothetical protein DL768_009058 [Monosporascus sp. mg162]
MASHKVLMLGTGFVTKPALDILSESGIFDSRIRRISLGRYKDDTLISLDVTNEQALDAELAKHDLVISLIPYTFHVTVIKSAI